MDKAVTYYQQYLTIRGDDKIKLDEGKLVLVNNEILQTTGTIQLKADFPNAAHLLWPGELINARLLLETRRGTFDVVANPGQVTGDISEGHVAQVCGSFLARLAGTPA